MWSHQGRACRGGWIPSLKWPPNSPRWAPAVTWSYLDALHRNVGEISEFLLNVGVEFTKKIDVRKGWVMARLGFVSLVWCCMNLYDLYGSFEIAIFPIVKSCVFVWSWLLFSNEQGGAFQPLPQNPFPIFPRCSQRIRIRFFMEMSQKIRTKSAMRIYEDYVDRRNKTNG